MLYAEEMNVSCRGRLLAHKAGGKVCFAAVSALPYHTTTQLVDPHPNSCVGNTFSLTHTDECIQDL